MLKIRNKSFIIGILILVATIQVKAQDKETEAIQSAPIDSTQEKLFLDKISVTGKLEKPQAVFVLPGQTPEIDDIQIKRSFIKELFRPVEKLDHVQATTIKKPLKKQPQ